MAYKDFPDDEIEEFGRRAIWLEANHHILMDSMRVRIQRLGELHKTLLNAEPSEYQFLAPEGILHKLTEINQLIAQTEEALESLQGLLEPSG